jgi:hypothetical protein
VRARECGRRTAVPFGGLTQQRSPAREDDVATWADVAKVLRGETTHEKARGLRRWRTKKGLVAWERPLRPADLEALGDAAPDGPILGVRVPLEVKEALLAAKPHVYFTTPHFDGYPAVLLRLPKIRVSELRSLLESALATRR